MCWSFGLFISGMATLSICQIVLLTASSFNKTTMLNRGAWDYYLRIGITLSGVFVVAALCVLLVTVLKLEFNPVTPGSHVYGDSPPNFSVKPIYASIFTFVVSYYLPPSLPIRRLTDLADLISCCRSLA
jgi:hypothetical protein